MNRRHLHLSNTPPPPKSAFDSSRSPYNNTFLMNEMYMSFGMRQNMAYTMNPNE
jgi:hypothetical protein